MTQPETVEQTTAPDRFIIRIAPGNRFTAWRATQKALIQAGCQVFVRSGSLVEPLWREEKTDDNQNVLAMSFVKYNLSRLSDVTARHAVSFVKYDARARQWLMIDPPKDVIETLLERGDWDFPTVRGIINTPTMRPDGTLLTTPGYDAVTQLWYKGTADVELPPIADKPTKAKAEEALKCLLDLLSEFPFVTNIDRSVAVAAIMTVVLRGAFEVAPLFFFHKPEPGTGASFLVKLISSIATGQAAAPTIASEDPKELQKELSAVAFSGKPILNLNNLTFDLKSPLLAQMVTEGIVDIRPFGKNTETVLCDCRATTAFANGNNIMVVGELVRRTVTSRMDANIEQPELRKFKSDPIEKVLRNRGKYLAAIFTIVRAHMAAKAPPGAAIAVAGFERWSKIVQQPLMWLGQEDPMKSQEEARAQDPERGALKERIEALKNHFGTANFTAAKINELAKMSGSGNPDLFAAYSRGANVMGTKSIGRLLIKDLGRVVNGWKIAVTRDRRLGNVYYLVQEPGAGAGDNGDSVDDADAMAAGRDAGFD